MPSSNPQLPLKESLTPDEIRRIHELIYDLTDLRPKFSEWADSERACDAFSELQNILEAREEPPMGSLDPDDLGSAYSFQLLQKRVDPVFLASIGLTNELCNMPEIRRLTQKAWADGYRMAKGE